jgi:energy-coupling factor transporter ATP-binding protein EcfA2
MPSFSAVEMLVREGVLDASGGSGASHHGQLSIGGLSVKVVGSRGSDVAFDAEHLRFRVEAGDEDIEIQVSWVQGISEMPGRKLFDSGTTWRLYEHERGFRFDFGDPIFEGQPNKRLVVDQRFRFGTLEMSQEYFTVYPQVADPLGYPLDELLIMHRLTQERAIELHGVGIVGPNGANNLFIGHSGAGKSTTARLWTSLHNVEILSDDRIIVREHPVREHSASEDKIRKEKAYEGNLSADPTQIYMYGTPWHGEAHFALPQRAPLQRIFVLEHGHGNVLTRLSRSQMVAELFARAFVPFHRHEYVDHALSFLERVADSIPCYRYSFEPDARAVEKILQFND